MYRVTGGSSLLLTDMMKVKENTTLRKGAYLGKEARESGYSLELAHHPPGAQEPVP
jgi:hypothetical protein